MVGTPTEESRTGTEPFHSDPKVSTLQQQNQNVPPVEWHSFFLSPPPPLISCLLLVVLGKDQLVEATGAGGGPEEGGHVNPADEPPVSCCKADNRWGGGDTSAHNTRAHVLSASMPCAQCVPKGGVGQRVRAILHSSIASSP